MQNQTSDKRLPRIAISEFLLSEPSDFNLVNNSVNDQNINKIVNALENALIIFIMLPICGVKCELKRKHQSFEIKASWRCPT